MCGIIGYVGERDAQAILLDGLETLEYRGYDSAGLFVPGNVAIKAVGPIQKLREAVAAHPQAIVGHGGIAHTRWATHGAPTLHNAHPHSDMAQSLWLVHNGIIENWREIKEMLAARGMRFYSETDTEVLVKLIGSVYRGDLLAAVQEALRSVRGTYGIAIMSSRKPGEIITARMGSPIVIGLGIDGNLVASDVSALLAHTKDVIYLEDGEIALVEAKSYRVTTISGKKKVKESQRIEWDIESVQKNGYEHFMLKEIHEAPTVIENTIRGRLLLEKGRAKLGGLESYLGELAKLSRLQIVGCGSAYYAGVVGKYMLEEYAGLPVDVDLGSEYRYKTIFTEKASAALFISQSGETADTRESLQKAKAQGVPTFGIINVVGSTIARETDAGIYNHAGPEVAVASTKAFLSQLTALTLVTLLIGRERQMSLSVGQRIAAELQALPDILRTMLADTTAIEAIATKYAAYEHMMYIGRHVMAPIAYEGALKLKEVSYIHAEAYAGGELKHGPIALLDTNFPVVALAPRNNLYEKMISNIEEVKARQAPVIALATEGDTMLAGIADDVMYIPDVSPILQPLIATIPLQLFAYYVGVAKGFNVDRPRNLAKSVTVE